LKKLKFFKEGISSIDDVENIGAFVIFDKLEDKEKMKKLFVELTKSRMCKKAVWP
jgi:hypothetical protein